MTLEAQLAGLVRREVDDAVGAIVEKTAQRVVELLKTQTEPLQRLHEIRGGTPRAALAALARDAELRALGHRVGRGLRFRASEVRQLFAERQRQKCSL